jgi:hypothetical protein
LRYNERWCKNEEFAMGKHQKHRLYSGIVLLVVFVLIGVLLTAVPTVPVSYSNSSCMYPTAALKMSKSIYTTEQEIQIELNVKNCSHHILTITDSHFLYGSELYLEVNPPIVIPNNCDLSVVNVSSDLTMLRQGDVYDGTIDNPYLNSFLKTLRPGSYHIPYRITVACTKDATFFDHLSLIVNRALTEFGDRHDRRLDDFFHCHDSIDYPIWANGELSFVILP